MFNTKTMLIRLVAMLLVVMSMFSIASCSIIPGGNDDTTEETPDNSQNGGTTDDGKNDDNQNDDNQDTTCQHESQTEGKCDKCGEICPITIAEAIQIAAANPDGTTERYYIRATVKTLSNPAYGEMTIEDATGEIYVYGTYSHDGALKFPEMESTPVKGDEVLLHCILSQFNGTNQVKNARLIEFKTPDVEFDLTDYTEMTISEARDAEVGKLVVVEGVVARIAYANGMKPTGVVVVDSTSSIYIHDQDLAGQVQIGNTVRVAASKTYWVLGTEAQNAEKFGYRGANQLEAATVLSLDKSVVDFDKTWIESTTVKELLETPVTEDITNEIVKVQALVKKVPGNGFTNYYFFDIDGETGAYTYTQCNGNDFGWLDEFDGKICTVYLVAMNAKSSATECFYRLLPIEVIDEGYVFDTTKAAEYAVKYHGVVNFHNQYTGDPAATLPTVISSELLGFEGATLEYSSSNESVIYFTEAEGVVTFHCGNAGKATVTVTATYGEYTYSEDVEIVVVPNVDVDYISVADAIAATEDTEVIVKGIVGPSVVNKNAFYLFGEDGSVIAVLVKDAAIFSEIEIGHEVIIKGMREHHVKTPYSGAYVGEACIVEGEVIANYYGSHEYSTAKFVTGKTVDDLRNLDIMTDYSTTVFVVDAIVTVTETAYYTSISVKSTTTSTTITLYCSSAAQYSFLKAYSGQTVTLELAACNWNDKTYWAFCALAVVNADGTKTLNTLNFVD